jgi:hypothetical protein
MGQATKNWNWATEKAVANCDEDSIIMAVAAANNCLAGFPLGDVGALYLASNAAPCKEKSRPGIVAVASDLPQWPPVHMIWFRLQAWEKLKIPVTEVWKHPLPATKRRTPG